MAFKYTADLSDRFFANTRDVCSNIGAPVASVLGAMMSESGVRSSARNPRSSATGLIQWMGSLGVYPGGHSRDEFASLDAADQVTYCADYFAPYHGKLLNSAAVYLAIFLPAQLSLAGDPQATVAARGGPFGWAFEANAYFDFNGDKSIKVGELTESINRQCVGPRWTEIAQRAGLNTSPVNPPGEPSWASGLYDLNTPRGVQEALQKLGFNPGAIDGTFGPKTSAALRMFQVANRITVDGIYGAQTREAIRAALRTFNVGV